MTKFCRPSSLSCANMSISAINELFGACLAGDLAIAQRVVSQGAARANAATNGGIQPIHFACVYGHLEVAQW